MSGFPWWAWAILAGILGIAEMHVPGAYLIWMALGAAVTAFADAAFGMALAGQTATFAVASAVSCGAGFFVYRAFDRRGRRPSSPLNERGVAMLGARGTVCETFVNGHGKVRLGDSVWLATGPDMPQGAPIVVSAVQGTRLVVQMVPGAPAEVR
ncbi:MAG TPA: NfeD family protein [Stellaceae bacterium]|jgi:hypothetical protein|nr:NfeD family protein [Stellaceae bacterium]